MGGIRSKFISSRKSIRKSSLRLLWQLVYFQAASTPDNFSWLSWLSGLLFCSLPFVFWCLIIWRVISVGFRAIFHLSGEETILRMRTVSAESNRNPTEFFMLIKLSVLAFLISQSGWCFCFVICFVHSFYFYPVFRHSKCARWRWNYPKFSSLLRRHC